MVNKFPGLVMGCMAFFLMAAGELTVTSAAMTMEEIRLLFHRDTGSQWEEASSDERRAFLQKVRPSTPRNEWGDSQGLTRAAGRPSRGTYESADPIDIQTPFVIRQRFEKKYGKKWEGASEKDQDRFLEEYKRSNQKWERDEQRRLKAHERSEDQVKARRRRKNERLERKRINEENKEKADLRKAQDDREREEDRLRDAIEKINKTSPDRKKGRKNDLDDLRNELDNLR